MILANIAAWLFIAGIFTTAALLTLNTTTRPADPHMPADVDLTQAVETTKAITDAGPQQYRVGRGRGYGRGRV